MTAETETTTRRGGGHGGPDLWRLAVPSTLAVLLMGVAIAQIGIGGACPSATAGFAARLGLGAGS